MSILDYFKRENNKLDPCNNIYIQSPINQLRGYIKTLYNTASIKKSDHDAFLEFIDKNFPITIWLKFVDIMNNLLSIATCNDPTSCQNHEHDRQRITLDNFVTLSKFFHKVYGSKYDFEILESVAPRITDLIISEYDDIKFTKCQKHAINEMLLFLEDPNENVFGLFGYAGTGKTTLITKFVKEIVSKKYINSINFSAPTNKAVNVIKTNFADCISQFVLLNTPDANIYDTFNKQIDYLKSKGITTNLITVHKLLEYKNEINNKGEKIFKRSDKASNKILTNYDLITIDECSMLEAQIIIDLFRTINKLTPSFIKIIFIGDPAQLAPVRESTSCIFNTKRNEFREDLLTKYFNLDDKCKYKYDLNTFTADVIKCKKVILDEIVRSGNEMIKGVYNECRMWVLGQVKLPQLTKYKSANVRIYKHKKTIKKINSTWFKKYITYIQKNDTPVNNIILTWRNAQTDEYNTTIRKTLFKKPNINQYEPGDVLMMNEFYLLRPLETEMTENKYDKHDKLNKQNKLYTCEQIKVIEAELINHPIKRIVMPKIPEEYNKIIGTKIKRLITDINTRLPPEYQVWKLIVKKLIDNDVNQGFNAVDNFDPLDYLINSRYAIYAHKEEMIEYIKNDKNFIKKQLDAFSMFLEEKFPDKKKQEMLTETIVTEIWKQINEIIEEPFANVNICFSMTTHKSQSSTYYNVFIDVDDLISNGNEEDAKKCLYTAVTRTSHELHLLI